MYSLSQTERERGGEGRGMGVLPWPGNGPGTEYGPPFRITTRTASTDDAVIGTIYLRLAYLLDLQKQATRISHVFKTDKYTPLAHALQSSTSPSYATKSTEIRSTHV
jgi:hypothetical protein